MENSIDNSVPQIIKDVGFDFDWSEEKVWTLEAPIEEIDINSFRGISTFHFYGRMVYIISCPEKSLIILKRTKKNMKEL